ncbi:alpha/beta fold hydrolase [Alkalilimnicola ehrlichii]|uniref:alpha/beta fold hydrolase n=1 Tax=Alkalilimnicola ehrlichii TaxID=351052 RepID=UPI003BA36A2C
MAALQAVLDECAALQPATVGETPRTAIHTLPPATLYHYPPPADTQAPEPEARRPLLVLYSLVNRPYLLDLSPQRSLLRGLRDSGLPVYLLDWGRPEPADRFLGLDDYLCDILHEAVKEVSRRHGGQPVDLLGVCQGGTFSLCYTALHPERIGRLATLVTPVDFHCPGDTLGALARELNLGLAVETLGNIPADLLNLVFISLKPAELLSRRYLQQLPQLRHNRDALQDFLRMERWMYDSPDLSGRAFLEFVREFYQDNALARGTLTIGGREVDPTRIRQPVFNAYATADHLVPPAAARAMGTLLSNADYREEAVPGGHLGVMLSKKARLGLHQRLQDWLAQPLPAAP